MRQIVTSLGPAYIKLGQALSIRPDLLSPAAMVEMQKLCDKAGPASQYLPLQLSQQSTSGYRHSVYISQAFVPTGHDPECGRVSM